jgi:hypothetical protein
MDPWIHLGYQASALNRRSRHKERLPRGWQVRNRYKKTDKWVRLQTPFLHVNYVTQANADNERITNDWKKV